MLFNRLAIYVSHEALGAMAQLQTASVELRYSSFLKGKPFGSTRRIIRAALLLSVE
jgi:hypothetical protein